MKFRIEHETDDEKEYQAIMDTIKHYELSKPSLNSRKNQTACDFCGSFHNVKKIKEWGYACPLCKDNFD